MQLPKTFKDQLAEEFRFAATKMAETTNVQRKLFYYSAFFGETSRVLNRVWDSELSLLHLVLSSSHAQINTRANAVISGADRTIDLQENLPETLDKIADELAGVFEAKSIDSDKLSSIMQRIANVVYVTTGNGYYLYMKGTLKL